MLKPSDKVKTAGRRGRKATGLFKDEKIAGQPGNGQFGFLFAGFSERDGHKSSGTKLSSHASANPKGSYGTSRLTRKEIPDAIQFVNGALQRVSWENVGEVYLTDFYGPLSYELTSDISGRLRLARAGGTVTGYYLNGSSWVEIGSYPSTLPTKFNLAAWGPTGVFNPQGENVQVEFTSVPLPPTLLLLGSGLLGLGGWRRLRKS